MPNAITDESRANSIRDHRHELMESKWRQRGAEFDSEAAPAGMLFTNNSDAFPFAPSNESFDAESDARRSSTTDWTQFTRVAPLDLVDRDNFGANSKVSIDGDGWAAQAKLIADTDVNHQKFGGYVLGISGSHIIVGLKGISAVSQCHMQDGGPSNDGGPNGSKFGTVR